MKQSEKKRQQILFAAIDLFLDKGFASTSMDMLALKAQVSKRTVYNHFESKDVLFYAILEYMFSLIGQANIPEYDPNKALSGQLEHIAKLKLNLFSSQQLIDLARIVIPELLINPERMVEIEKRLGNIEADLISWFSQAAMANVLPEKHIQKYADDFIALIKMKCFWPLLFQTIDTPNEEKIEAIAQEVVYLFEALIARDAQQNT